jgi:hypothetical protein
MIMRMDLDMTVHKKGVEAVRGTVAHDMGVLTTPQLHWMVRSFNNGVPASESDYFHQLSDSFRCCYLSLLSITILTLILRFPGLNWVWSLQPQGYLMVTLIQRTGETTVLQN